MQLQYSSCNFSFKIGSSPHYILKSIKGYYIANNKENKYFSDFLLLSHYSNLYLVTISDKEFTIYDVKKEIEQIITISNLSSASKVKFFEYVILNADGDYVKITNDLKMS